MKPINLLAGLLLLTAVLALPGAGEPAASEPSADDAQSRIQELERRVDELERKLEEVEAGQDGRGLNPLPSIEEPALTEEIPAPQPTGSEKLLPDISVIVDALGTATSNGGDPDRNQFVIRETEVAVQGYVYPQVRGDVFIAFEEEELQGRVEEAYASLLQIGNTALNANLGKKYLPLGKNNPVHRERWPFVTQPFVVRNLMNPEEGLSGQGAQLNYLLPTKANLFAQMSFGVWKPSAHAHEEDEPGEEEGLERGLGAEDRVYSGRLWLSRPVGGSAELELGLNAAGGPGEEELGRPRTRLYGTDLTYRAWPGAYRRILLQGEAWRHRRSIPDANGSRDGYYGLAHYRWDRYNDAGVRYDWSELPAPQPGHDSGLSAFYTRWLSETSFIRLQVTRGKDVEDGDFTAALLQLVWGLGPHAHQLE
ncbi:MAG: hypothetical protein HYX78_02175 [Armatimonadetes bacterium]|nr:hypothetical protein [Armatimonadota bacterium]